MSDMVEKVARAIYLARNGKGATPWSIRPMAHKAPYLVDARAAIAVVARECVVDIRDRYPEDPPRWKDCMCAGPLTEKLADAALTPDRANIVPTQGVAEDLK